ncbi:hypothetical protein ACJMK2_026223 [Sinanodonta woodiana]|uniref:G-protein coupled receptors family 1 profile domain-containing protein n=1 Tax=Sinanodonta woodiana TaxID=1069815 RepID=A0ABD3XKS2_SINWO
MDSNLSSQYATNETLEELNLRFAEALVPVTIFLILLAVTGLIGNILVLFVFSRSKEYRKDKFRIFVISHCLIDLIECVSLIPAEVLKHQHYFAFENTAACKTKCFFNVFASSAASFMLILINIDRFRRICQPLKNQVGYGLAIKLSTGVCFISILLALPSVALCGIQENLMLNTQGGLTKVYVCSYEEIYKHNGWRKAYKIALLTLTFIMLVLCIIVYIFIGREIMTVFRRNCHPRFTRLNSAIPDVRRLNSANSDEMRLNSANSDKRRLNFANPEERKLNSANPDERRLNSANPDERILNSANPDESAPKLCVLSDVSDSRDQVMEVSFKNKESNNLSDVMQLDCMSTSARTVTLDSHIAHISKRHPSNYPISSYRKTLIWFIVTVIFVLTHLLYSALALKIDAIFTMRPSEFAVFSFFFRIYFVNSMANPIVYACLFERFRKVCKDYCIVSMNYIYALFYRQSNTIRTESVNVVFH